MSLAKSESSTAVIASMKNVTEVAVNASTEFIGEFLKDSLHSAVINPYNSAIQIANSASKAILDKDLPIETTDVLKPT